MYGAEYPEAGPGSAREVPLKKRSVSLRRHLNCTLKNSPGETIRQTDSDNHRMTAQAAPHVRKDHHAKKSSAKQNTREGEAKNVPLCCISTFSFRSSG